MYFVLIKNIIVESVAVAKNVKKRLCDNSQYLFLFEV